MPRRKFENDEQRMNAVREARKKYYLEHRDVLVNRSRQWRADRKAAMNVAQPEPLVA